MAMCNSGDNIYVCKATNSDKIEVYHINIPSETMLLIAQLSIQSDSKLIGINCLNRKNNDTTNSYTPKILCYYKLEGESFLNSIPCFQLHLVDSSASSNVTLRANFLFVLDSALNVHDADLVGINIIGVRIKLSLYKLTLNSLNSTLKIECIKEMYVDFSCMTESQPISFGNFKINHANLYFTICINNSIRVVVLNISDPQSYKVSSVINRAINIHTNCLFTTNIFIALICMDSTNKKSHSGSYVLLIDKLKLTELSAVTLPLSALYAQHTVSGNTVIKTAINGVIDVGDNQLLGIQYTVNSLYSYITIINLNTLDIKMIYAHQYRTTLHHSYKPAYLITLKHILLSTHDHAGLVCHPMGKPGPNASSVTFMFDKARSHVPNGTENKAPGEYSVFQRVNYKRINSKALLQKLWVDVNSIENKVPIASFSLNVTPSQIRSILLKYGSLSSNYRLTCWNSLLQPGYACINLNDSLSQILNIANLSNALHFNSFLIYHLELNSAQVYQYNNALASIPHYSYTFMHIFLVVVTVLYYYIPNLKYIPWVLPFLYPIVTSIYKLSGHAKQRASPPGTTVHSFIEKYNLTTCINYSLYCLLNITVEFIEVFPAKPMLLYNSVCAVFNSEDNELYQHLTVNLSVGPDEILRPVLNVYSEIMTPCQFYQLLDHILVNNRHFIYLFTISFYIELRYRILKLKSFEQFRKFISNTITFNVNQVIKMAYIRIDKYSNNCLSSTDCVPHIGCESLHLITLKTTSSAPFHLHGGFLNPDGPIEPDMLDRIQVNAAICRESSTKCCGFAVIYRYLQTYNTKCTIMSIDVINRLFFNSEEYCKYITCMTGIVNRYIDKIISNSLNSDVKSIPYINLKNTKPCTYLEDNRMGNYGLGYNSIIEKVKKGYTTSIKSQIKECTAHLMKILSNESIDNANRQVNTGYDTQSNALNKVYTEKKRLQDNLIHAINYN